MDLIRDKPLEGLFAGLKTAADILQHGRMTFQSGLSAVLLPIARFQDRLDVLIRETEALTRLSIPLSDVLNGRPMDRAADGLQAQAEATGRLPSLKQLSGLTGRLKANLESSASSPRQVTLAGGDLYALAAKEYRDATAWQTIADANGLDDPVIHGVKTLTIPERPMSRSMP